MAAAGRRTRTARIHLAVGDVVEEMDELVNPEDRTHVALACRSPPGWSR